MSEPEKPRVGAVRWMDLTVEDAGAAREFYSAVVGWKSTGLDMGGYEDYCMNEPGSGTTVAGVCHARGGNAGLPPQWLIYIDVEDLDRSLARCAELGGEKLGEIRSMSGQGRYCVIRDPAGAVAALFEPER